MRNSQNNLDELTFPVVKMQGRGNDFVLMTAGTLAEVLEKGLKEVLAQSDYSIEALLSQLARLVCDRRYSLGGDGLIIAVPLVGTDSSELGRKLLEYVSAYRAHADANALASLQAVGGAHEAQATVAWIYINSDGSYSAICGNGLRCFAWYCKAQGLFPGKVLQVSTATGLVELELAEEVPNGNLGSGLVTSRITAPSSVTYFGLTQALAGQLPESFDATGYQGCLVDMGNPHYVVYFPEEVFNPWWEALGELSIEGSNGFTQVFPPEVLSLAQKIQENSEYFPEGVNVEFACLTPPRAEAREQQEVRVLVVERGCGPTLACASGACAVVVAGVKEKLFAGECCVNLPGGSLAVGWSCGDSSVKLTGWAQVVMEGALHIGKAELHQVLSKVLVPVSEVAL